MNPRDLLSRMADVYAAAKTYADRGRARYLWIHPSSRSLERETFVTFLDRERGFRLEAVKSPSEREVILWKGHGSARLLSHDRTRYESIARVVAMRHFEWFTFAVPSLLIPQEFGTEILRDVHDLVYQGREAVGLIACHRVLGHLRDRTELTLWLDEDRLLLRRLIDRTEYPHGSEAAALREEQLRRRDHALAAGVDRKIVDRAFGPERLLALKHWPYARPREDSRRITRVAYQPRIGIPIDPSVFKRKSTAV